MNTSTIIPGPSMPPTARSSGTVSDTARHASESGPTVSSGPRIENSAPAVVDASRLVVTSWPTLASTARMRPTSCAGSVTTPSAFVPSSGMSDRTTTSVASIGLRAGIATAATTPVVVLRPDWPACCCALLIRKNAAPPATTASTTPSRTIHRPRLDGSLYSISIAYASRSVGSARSRRPLGFVAVPDRLVPRHQPRHLTATQVGVVHVGVDAADRIAVNAVAVDRGNPVHREAHDVYVLGRRAGGGDVEHDRHEVGDLLAVGVGAGRPDRQGILTGRERPPVEA